MRQNRKQVVGCYPEKVLALEEMHKNHRRERQILICNQSRQISPHKSHSPTPAIRRFHHSEEYTQN
jgi:hypothetical protein